MTSTILSQIAAINEIERKFETEVVKYATKPPHESFMMEIEQIVDKTESAKEITAEDFVAFSILVNYQRRMKNFEKERRLINTWRHKFAEGHPFFVHMELLAMMDNVEDYTPEEMIAMAQNNCRHLTGNFGALHAYCETVALLYETNDASIMEPLKSHLAKAVNDIDSVITEDSKYAKYYCTKGRLLAVNKMYDQAIYSITKAIDYEDSKRTDYTLRINQYQMYLQQAKNLKSLEKTEETLNKKIQEFEDLIEQQSKESLIKNMEYLGLFAGIISFTIGSISISSSMASQSLIAAAGLIIVLLGALLCVFAGFGVILHGFNKKSGRNLFVFAMGALIVLGGVYLCYI